MSSRSLFTVVRVKRLTGNECHSKESLAFYCLARYVCELEPGEGPWQEMTTVLVGSSLGLR